MLKFRAALIAGAVSLALVGVAGCGSGSPSDSTVVSPGSQPADANSTITTGTPSNPQSNQGSTTPGGSTAAGATDTTIQRNVTGTIIDTPPEIAANIPTSSVVGLQDDYVPASPNINTVLQAVVPVVTIFESATSNKVALTLTNPQPSGAPLALLVDGQTSNRYKVLLPIRPNGSTGWVDPNQVKKFQHTYKLVVELSAHRITAYEGKNVILSEKIATGRDDTPTPNGRYYIKELLRPCYSQKSADGIVSCVPNDKGLYGPFAYGLSGFSPVLTNFNGGTGVLGIHGTDQPQLLGTDVSHGCIRMSNSGISILAKILPLGTPVVVRP